MVDDTCVSVYDRAQLSTTQHNSAHVLATVCLQYVLKQCLGMDEVVGGGRWKEVEWGWRWREVEWINRR